MAKGRIRNRLELRAQAEAAERRQQDGDETEEEEEDEDDEAAGEQEPAEEAADDEEEEVVKEKPKKRKPAAKTSKPRSRAAKVVRMKVVWGVFNNSNQRVAVFDYPKRKEADEHAAKLSADKKTTFFVQPVKEPIEEKKEA
jgi:hypothetical protein